MILAWPTFRGIPSSTERVDVRLELVRVYRRIDRLSPKLHRDVIRDELAFARIFKKGFADFCARVDGAEYIAASAMIVTRDRAERLALGAFAAARRAKKKKGVVFHHHGNRLYRKSIRSTSRHSDRSRGTPTDPGFRTESFEPDSSRDSR